MGQAASATFPNIAVMNWPFLICSRCTSFSIIHDMGAT
jgi:hypothetical protein